MTLTKSEIAAVYRSCETGRGITFNLWYDIVGFYGREIIEDAWSWDNDTAENERIMALLFFIAAGGEL